MIESNMDGVLHLFALICGVAFGYWFGVAFQMGDRRGQILSCTGIFGLAVLGLIAYA